MGVPGLASLLIFKPLWYNLLVLSSIIKSFSLKFLNGFTSVELNLPSFFIWWGELATNIPNRVLFLFVEIVYSKFTEFFRTVGLLLFYILPKCGVWFTTLSTAELFSIEFSIFLSVSVCLFSNFDYNCKQSESLSKLFISSLFILY